MKSSTFFLLLNNNQHFVLLCHLLSIQTYSLGIVCDSLERPVGYLVQVQRQSSRQCQLNMLCAQLLRHCCDCYYYSHLLKTYSVVLCHCRCYFHRVVLKYSAFGLPSSTNSYSKNITKHENSLYSAFSLIFCFSSLPWPLAILDGF